MERFDSEKIKEIVNDFKKETKEFTRNASFDYCYNYFRTTPKNKLVDDMEKSCSMLGFYLASWGMMRGSSFLLKEKNLKHFEEIIKYISTQDEAIWNIDVDNYEKNMNKIIEIYDKIKHHLFTDEQQPSDILITKVMLGVFGFVPALDTYFSKTFGFSKLNEKNLKLIANFYIDHGQVIDEIHNETFTINFSTGKFTKIKYPKAKIVDMFGFQKSYGNYSGAK